MTMWSAEWMIVYVIVLLIGNILILAVTGRFSRRGEPAESSDSDRSKDLTTQSRRHMM